MPSFAFPDASVADLAAFLRTILPPIGGGNRGAINAVVVGNARAGEAYFNGAGRCTTCHSPTGDLKGIGSRLPVAAIQGRAGHAARQRRLSALVQLAARSEREAAQGTVTITPIRRDDLRHAAVDHRLQRHADRAAGVRRTVARNGDVPKVEVTDPLQCHIEHMKKLTDKDMHDLTAYLVTLK